MTTVQFIFKPSPDLLAYLEKGLGDNAQIELRVPEDEEIETKSFKDLDAADIIIGWRPTIQLLRDATKTVLFINPGAGVQHLIPMFREVASEREITLVNGHGNAYFTAQHGVAMLLSLTNKILPHHNWLQNGQWRTGDAEGTSLPLRDLKIGLLGYGNINSKVHRFLSGFDLDFHILRNSSPGETDKQTELATFHQIQDLHNFLNIVDVLIIAVPLTSKTENLIRKEELNLLGPHGLLVNIGRGAVVNEKDLFEALKNKSIAGAALDVWYDNDPPTDESGKRYPYHYPFHQLDNLVLSPHRAASPFSDLKRWGEVIENILRFHSGKQEFLNQVDLEKEY